MRQAEVPANIRLTSPTDLINELQLIKQFVSLRLYSSFKTGLYFFLSMLIEFLVNEQNSQSFFFSTETSGSISIRNGYKYEAWSSLEDIKES